MSWTEKMRGVVGLVWAATAALAFSLDEAAVGKEDLDCSSDADCVHDGICRKASPEAERGRCLCFRSCSKSVPVGCKQNSNCVSSAAVCNKPAGLCVCPPSALEACAKHKLAIIRLSATKDTPYQVPIVDL